MKHIIVKISFRIYYVPGTIINRPVIYIIFPNAANSPLRIGTLIPPILQLRKWGHWSGSIT